MGKDAVHGWPPGEQAARDRAAPPHDRGFTRGSAPAESKHAEQQKRTAKLRNGGQRDESATPGELPAV